MSEPRTLYDKYGYEVVTASPSWAHAMIVAGLLFEQPPAKPVQPVEQSPDDTQEVPVVPTGKARRKGKGNSGVLL